MASPYLPTEQAVAQSSPEVLGIERCLLYTSDAADE